MNKKLCAMNGKLSFLFVVTIFLFSLVPAFADNEKPVIIKGLFIGMNANEAKTIITNLLPKSDWKVTETGKTFKLLPRVLNGDNEIFGNKTPGDDSRIGGITGEYGFAIIDKDESYEGFISIDEETVQVVRMSFSGRITDILFDSSAIYANQFATSFWENHNMPAFNWIPRGWIYTSPLGYVITIKTDKFLDIKARK